MLTFRTPAAGSPSGSAAPGQTKVQSTRSRGTQLSQVRSFSPSVQGGPCRSLLFNAVLHVHVHVQLPSPQYTPSPVPWRITPWRAQTNTTHVILKFHVVNYFTVEKHNTRYHAGYMYLDGSSRYTQIQAGYMRNVSKIHEGYIRDTCLRPSSYAAPGQHTIPTKYSLPGATQLSLVRSFSPRRRRPTSGRT